MFDYGLNFLYIAFGILVLVLLLANLYWGTFLLLLTQPLFITVTSEHAGLGVTKVIYGVLFAVWFVAWALKPVARDTTRLQLRSSMRAPALALGAVLGVAVLVGLLYGAPLGNIVRDLSQFVGYLAVLPLLDLVRTPKQAKRLLLFLALVGLPPGRWLGFLKDGTTYTSFNYPGPNVLSTPTTVPYGINDSGQISGMYRVTGPYGHGFLKDGATWISFDYPGALETVASGINDSGQIVGYYYDGPTIHGFFVEPPYPLPPPVPLPSSLLLVCSGLMGLAGWRRLRKS